MSYRTVVSNSRKNMNTAVWKCAVQQSIQRRKRSRSTPNVSPWANHQNRLDTNNSYLSNGPDGNDEFTFNRTKSKCIWEWKSIRIYIIFPSKLPFWGIPSCQTNPCTSYWVGYPNYLPFYPHMSWLNPLWFPSFFISTYFNIHINSQWRCMSWVIPFPIPIHPIRVIPIIG